VLEGLRQPNAATELTEETALELAEIHVAGLGAEEDGELTEVMLELAVGDLDGKAKRIRESLSGANRALLLGAFGLEGLLVVDVSLAGDFQRTG